MADIYEQHKAAFARVSAFVILNGEGERVATVALKFPADGAGRLYAYFHLIGEEMVRSFATGYGYDKRSAAVASAIGKIPRRGGADGIKGEPTDYDRLYIANRDAFQKAAPAMDCDDWLNVMRKAGYTVLQAV